MTIRAVTYYEAWCDCGCGMRLDLGEFTAMADEDDAAESVRDSEGVVCADGRVFCYSHTPPDLCREHDNGVHVFDEDGDCDCGAEKAAAA